MNGETEDFFKFVTLLGERSENFKFLNCFVWDEVSAILHLLETVQTGNFKDRCIAIKRCIPMYFSGDATN